MDFNLIDDAVVEFEDEFSLTLSAPTGGAAIGASQAVTIIVNDDDDASGGGGGDGDGDGNAGGGGASGAWSLLFLLGFVFAGSAQRRRKYLSQT